MTKLKPIAVIGAGIAGLSCARALERVGLKVHLYEKSKRPGGRCATRLWQAHLVDYGVQYFTAETARFKKELLNQMFHFRPLIHPILDHEGTIIENTGSPRFYGLQGNNFLCHVMAKGLDIRLEKTVEHIQVQDQDIECMGEHYAALICTAPGPQTAAILGIDAKQFSYEPSLVGLVEYQGMPTGNLLQTYARFDFTGTNPLQWSACENHKAGRIIGERTVFVLQASNAFTQNYLETPPEDYLPPLIKAHEELWEIPSSRRCLTLYGHRWRYARSIKPVPYLPDLPPGIFVCGDSCAASDVEEVWANGQDVANQVIAYIN